MLFCKALNLRASNLYVKSPFYEANLSLLTTIRKLTCKQINLLSYLPTYKLNQKDKTPCLLSSCYLSPHSCEIILYSISLNKNLPRCNSYTFYLSLQTHSLNTCLYFSLFMQKDSRRLSLLNELSQKSLLINQKLHLSYLSLVLFKFL
jgi:hypothetical protein